MLTRLGLSRGQFLIALLLAAILVVLAALQNQRVAVEPYDPEQSSPQGLRALVLWLQELGHPVTMTYSNPEPPDQAALYWLHPGQSGSGSRESEAAISQLYDWVEAGGTLVMVGPRVEFSLLSRRFGVVQGESLSGIVEDVQQLQPLLPDTPASWEPFFAPTTLQFDADRAVVPVLGHSNGAPVVALQHIGEGVVWHLTEDFALTNGNLRDERIASLLPAILRTVPEGAPVAFSTHHLTRFAPLLGIDGGVYTLQDWLYATPFGRGTLLIMVATFVFLLLQGRRLGPPLPGPTAARPREAAEFVNALAGLQRRIRQPRLVAEHHCQRLKSTAGRLAHAPADLPDAEWLAQVRRAEVLPPATLHEVTELLTQYAEIGNKRDADADLIQLVRATDRLLATLPRANSQLVR